MRIRKGRTKRSRENKEVRKNGNVELKIQR